MAEAVRALLQALQIMRIIAPFPTVKGLRGDVKMAAGEPGIVTTRPVVIKPFKSLPGFPG